MSITDDPKSLARYIETLGGEIVPADNFRFSLPLGEVRRVVPELNKLNLRCTKVNEVTGNDRNGKSCTIVTIGLSRQPEEKSEYEQERGLMAALIR
jgi:hypothetical protein